MKTLAVDKYQRVRLPDAKGGQRFAYTNHGNGSFTLVLVRAEAEERPLDRHLYDNYPEEASALEAATAKTDASAEERDRR